MVKQKCLQCVKPFKFSRVGETEKVLQIVNLIFPSRGDLKGFTRCKHFRAYIDSSLN
jgi:hypothetical protein